MMYAIEMSDGSVEIMQTVGNATVEQCLAKWAPDHRARVVAHRPFDPSTIPADREFRNAWKLDGDRIGIDMDKARAIHLERIKRATVAAEATEAARLKAEAVSRDYSTTLEAAQTPDELKAIWPVELGERNGVRRT